MDINDLRIAVTVISLLLFVALVAYTWSRRRTAEYASAALLPFAEEGKLTGNGNGNGNGNDSGSGSGSGNTIENRGDKP